VDVKEGDILVVLNGEKIKSLAQFTKIYDEIKVGDKVQLVTIREKKEFNVKFKKPETEGQVFIKEN
jgi:S1-C subfamily serine protease